MKPPKAHWWWVRHGPTHEKNFVGWRDVPADLSDVEQLARLSEYLPQAAKLVSSDLIRARDTAQAIAAGRSSLGCVEDLREFNFGVWDGMHYEAVAARDPELSRAFWESPGDLSAPGGESWNGVAGRVSRAVDRINAEHSGHIIAVAHIGVIMTQIQRAMGCTPYQALGHKIDNLSVTDMTWDGQRWEVQRINHTL